MAKRFVKTSLLVIAVVMLCFAVGITVNAETSGDYNYILLEDGTVEIGAYTGSDTKLNIPAEIDGKPVTSIGEGAFADCSGLTGDLIIPEGVTSIGDYAFFGCYGLTGDLIIPEGVTSIGVYAFYNCSGLTGDLTIPKSVTSIGEWAFNNCSGLTGDLIIPEGVTRIGEMTFNNCSGLTGDLIIPEGITSIGNCAFFHCSGLTSDLIIPESVTSIGDYAFYHCYGLTGDLIIPESVTSIGEGVFAICKGLTGDLIIPEGVISIGEGAFADCSGLTGDLIIPEGVISIGGHAFNNCKGLTGDLIIPENVTSIGYTAFGFCYGLTGDLIIPEGVTSIGDYAFYDCYGLTGDLIIPESVTSIGDEAFHGCYGLEHVTYKGNDEQWNNISLGNDIFSLTDTFYLHLNFNMETDVAEIVVPSTCQSEGVEGLVCSCGYIYSATYFDKLDHTYESVVTLPTCTEKGYTTYTCECGDSYISDYVKQNGHKYTSEITISATHLIEGVETFTCACGDTYTKVIDKLKDHTYESVVTLPTCTEKGYTTYTCECGNSYISEFIGANGHNLTDWVNDEENGVATRECNNCDYSETVPLTNQGEGDVEIIAPENPDFDFDIDNIEGNSEQFIVIEETVTDNIGTEWEVLKAFDITLKNNDGVHVQPDGIVKVKLPLDWEKDGNYKVYRVNEDGTLTDMNAYLQGSHVVFETDHFSVYVIVEENTEDTPSEPELPSDDCSHMCHKTGFMGFIWKIINFFQKLFRVSPVCDCGVVHY